MSPRQAVARKEALAYQGADRAGKARILDELVGLYRLDIENIAVSIAGLTLWMGQRQMIDRYGRPRIRCP